MPHLWLELILDPSSDKLMLARFASPPGSEAGFQNFFTIALAVALCVDDGAAASPPGFYLLTLKGSQQEGLTGVKGSVLRRVVVDKTRSSLESALASIKRALEASPRR